MQPTPPLNSGTIASLNEEGGVIHASGRWDVHHIDRLEKKLAAGWQPDRRSTTLNASAIERLDTAGAWLLKRTLMQFEKSGYRIELQGMQQAHTTLIELISSESVEPPHPVEIGLLERIGREFYHHLQIDTSLLEFIGEIGLLLWRAILNPLRIRFKALLTTIKEVGFDALPIIGLLSFLTGIVLAYQGAVQLQRFGANIFIVDLVSLSLLRELSPLLTAIIVAGRSGSAFTAQIGTMKVTEEIDALRTMGIAPLEQLVIPKLLALIIALPLLTIFADILGILGGMLMAYIELGVGASAFVDRLSEAVSLSSFLTGLAKAPVFAAVIAIVGCFQGFQVTGSAESVGRQTTVSVVQSIFMVIVIDAIFSVIYSLLRI